MPPRDPRTQAFTALDWGLLSLVAALWGSSFLLIEIGLEHLQPTAVSWLRIVLGAAALALVPAARRPVRRADWPLVGLLGLVWMAVPFVLFPLAQQSIDSSLAGMINAAAPLFTAAIAALWARSWPRGAPLLGLLVGFAGVVAVNWPAAQGADATAVGAGMVLLATLLYGVAFNLADPLEARNGALPVIWRAQLVAALAVAPAGGIGIAGSTWAWSSMLAMLLLGALSTGVAFVAFATLVGLVGPARGSVAVYLVPVVAIALGSALRDETVAALAVAGTALILVGAYLTSRGGGGHQATPPTRPDR